jgi:hypothetical protein
MSDIEKALDVTDKDIYYNGVLIKKGCENGN